ncbi:Tigger transposable element-derived protein 6 [Trichinella sp. T8]|nr:Tigger transposable element-derived protein 6 [Trichinella sp. T8]
MVDGLTDLYRDMVLYTAVYVVKSLALIRVQLTHGRTDCKFCLTITNHLDDVLNDGEMGLFYRILISRQKTLTFKGENSTVLLCCNENGTEMLRPLVIGRAKNPR